MNATEAQTLRRAGGRLRPTEPHARPLPWDSLDHALECEGPTGYEWTPEREDAFLLLVLKGYTPQRICSQARRGWPTYADFLEKCAKDADFQDKCAKSTQKSGSSHLAKSIDFSESATPSTVSVMRLAAEHSLKIAALVDPERYAPQARAHLSGSLALGVGSLADLAAAAAQRVTGGALGGTERADSLPPSPNNLDAPGVPE